MRGQIIASQLSRYVKLGLFCSVNLFKMSDRHVFQATRNDPDSCTLIFFRPRTPNFQSNEIEVDIFHPRHGITSHLQHVFENRETESERCSTLEFRYPGLPQFVAKLWPRSVEISMGNTVWTAKGNGITESRPEAETWVYIREDQCEDEPATPFEEDDIGEGEASSGDCGGC